MEEVEIEYPPLSQWLAERLERHKLEPLEPTPSVTFYARTSRDAFAEWFDAHLPGPIDLDGGDRMQMFRSNWHAGEGKYPDIAIGCDTLVSVGPGKWRTTFETGRFQVVLIFKPTPLSADRCEITVRWSPDPRVRPFIVSLLRDIARAWPEAAEALAPFIAADTPAAPGPDRPESAQGTAPAKPAPTKGPRIPVKPGALHRWRMVWRRIRPWYDEGKSCIAISQELRAHAPDLAFSVETIERIIAAGRAGLLD
jgi:hypothetical protein